MKRYLTYTGFAFVVLAWIAFSLRGDEPLDTPNLIGYWIVAPALLGYVLVLLRMLWDWIVKIARKSDRGQWPKP